MKTFFITVYEESTSTALVKARNSTEALEKAQAGNWESIDLKTIDERQCAFESDQGDGSEDPETA